ncbi:PAP2-domain-containing protein [Macrolepiota fuliginosa MF-IS2]|uniref:PAP2-domain-containing protein n=1 Tax=Macrolepiota fuliginosa MF-IS2 TaxID=1400762 RepID=A0A9P6C499_9AGAR|nr:PAP2-domain-containing protein [Macrolepiota fuliginosa MF-IS2]
MGVDNHVSHNFTRLALSFLDKTNGIVTSLTATFLLYTRSSGVAYFVAGASTCSLTVKLIKRAIQQPRPPPMLAGRKTKASYGMPSTHSATITFFTAYILLACLYLPTHKTLPLNPFVTRLMPPLVTIPWAVAIIMSRVWLGYHTWAQVAAGSAYGGALAMVWFTLWTGSGLNEAGQEVERIVWTSFGW